MPNFACLIKDQFVKIKRRDSQPDDIPHKNIRWIPVEITHVAHDAIPVDAEVGGKWQTQFRRPKPETYRDKRQHAYAIGLSEEQNIMKSIGDTLDALVDAAYGDKTKLDALKVKIDAIKATNPKG